MLGDGINRRSKGIGVGFLTKVAEMPGYPTRKLLLGGPETRTLAATVAMLTWRRQPPGLQAQRGATGTTGMRVDGGSPGASCKYRKRGTMLSRSRASTRCGTAGTEGGGGGEQPGSVTDTTRRADRELWMTQKMSLSGEEKEEVGLAGDGREIAGCEVCWSLLRRFAGAGCLPVCWRGGVL